MTNFSQDPNQSAFTINRYHSGEVIVNNTAHQKNLVIFKDSLEDWPVTSLEQLDTDALQILLDKKPELIVIGTGEKHLFPSRELVTQAGLAGVGLEFMSSEQACRTYNLLASDGREALLALILS